MPTALLKSDGFAGAEIRQPRSASRSVEAQPDPGIGNPDFSAQGSPALMMLFGVSYFVAAELAHTLTIKPDGFTAFWAPAGLYLAALVLTPVGRWPLLILAALAADFTSDVLVEGRMPAVSFGFFIVNTLTALAGAGLIRRFGSRPFRLDLLRNVFVLGASAALAAALVGALGGAALVSLAFGVSFSGAWVAWWCSDFVGMCVMAPLVFCLMEIRPQHLRELPLRRIAELWISICGLLAAAWLVFLGDRPWLWMPWMVLPFVGWLTLRFETRGASAAMVAVAFLATAGVVFGSGPFQRPSFLIQLEVIHSQLFLSTWALVFQSFAAILAERRRAKDALAQSNHELERRVASRTAELTCTHEILRKSEARLRDALKAGRVFTFECNWVTREVVRSCSSNAILGLPAGSERDSLEGFLTQVHPADRAGLCKVLSGLTPATPRYSVDYRVICRPAAREVWLKEEGKATFDANGALLRIHGVARDHTAGKRAGQALREREARFRSAFYDAASPMAVTKADGSHKQVNGAYCELMGYSQAEILAISFEALTHPEDRQMKCLEPLRRLMAGEVATLRLEKRYLHKSGRVIWAHLSISMVEAFNGRPAYFIIQIHDLTARKAAEETIRSLNGELELRVAARTTELREANRQLRAEFAECRRLEQEILEISEREQCRLGQDLHDGLGQELAGIALLGQVLASRLHEDGSAHAAPAADIARFTAATIETTRNLAKGFYPVELNRYGLLIALEDLANQTSRRFRIDCVFEKSLFAPRLEKSAEIHLYRLVQESISNAIKHGQANRIAIGCHTVGGVATLSVTSDGIGYEKPAAGNPGMGMHLMGYRARLLGAALEISRPPNGGCQVLCRLCPHV